jgi:hypothetical protein
MKIINANELEGEEDHERMRMMRREARNWTNTRGRRTHERRGKGEKQEIGGAQMVHHHGRLSLYAGK